MVNRAGLNVHIFPAPLTHQGRALKITKSLVDSGIFKRIVLYGVWEEGTLEREKLDDRREIHRIRLLVNNNSNSIFSKIIKTIQCSIWTIFELRGEKISCINCHSLPVLPLCVYLKRMTNALLIYDTHELETETVGVRGIRKKVMKFLERHLIKYADAVSVVSDSIADWYRKEYGLSSIAVVRNIPYRTTVPSLKRSYFRDYFLIPSDHLIFLYQGMISSQRGIDLLLKVFSQLHRSKHLVLMGYGDGVDKVLSYAGRCENIHYHQAVPPSEVQQYTCGADVGVHLIEDVCLNHHYCLPNKIWEYLSAGIPVIVSDLPEMAKVVHLYNCGWTCRPLEETAYNLFRQITPGEIALKKTNVLKSQKFYGWGTEEERLLGMYHRLGYQPQRHGSNPLKSKSFPRFMEN